jgi:hypothetical protein
VAAVWAAVKVVAAINNRVAVSNLEAVSSRAVNNKVAHNRAVKSKAGNSLAVANQAKHHHSQPQRLTLTTTYLFDGHLGACCKEVNLKPLLFRGFFIAIETAINFD